MKQVWVVGMGVALMLAASLPALGAVAKGELLVGATGNWGLPVADYPTAEFGDKVQSGFGFGAAVDKMLTDRISVGAELGVNINAFDQDFIADSLNTGSRFTPDYNWRTMQLSGRGRYHLLPERTVSFFGQVGLGVYINKFSSNLNWDRANGVVTEMKRSDTRTNLGVNLGPGALIRVSQYARLSLEAILNNVFTSGKSLRFVNVSAGLTFHIPTQ